MQLRRETVVSLWVTLLNLLPLHIAAFMTILAHTLRKQDRSVRVQELKPETPPHPPRTELI